MHYGGVDVHLVFALLLIGGMLGMAIGFLSFALLAAHCGALGR